MKKYKLYLLDMDGTLYISGRLFPETLPFLDFVKKNGARFMFLTNNSSKSAGKYLEKLRGMGIDFAAEDDFLTSTHATIKRLVRDYSGKKLYAFGTRSFVSELRAAGLDCVTDLCEGISALVMGFDTELTFKKLDDACRLLVSGVDYIATHPDFVCPTEYGSVPDCGCVADMLFTATGRRPEVIGKPQPAMVELALERAGVEKRDAILIGDRLYTDIACGQNAGIDTAFVLSGEGRREDVCPGSAVPTYIIDNIGGCIV